MPRSPGGRVNNQDPIPPPSAPRWYNSGRNLVSGLFALPVAISASMIMHHYMPETAPDAVDFLITYLSFLGAGYAASCGISKSIECIDRRNRYMLSQRNEDMREGLYRELEADQYADSHRASVRRSRRGP